MSVAVEILDRVDPYAYEHEQRRKISERDWAALHTASDRRSPLHFVTYPIRRVIGSGVRTERGGFRQEERP